MNLDEVAKRAKVSSATVSRVLNNIDVVKNATRTRVMKAVEELQYHPNLHARSLARGDTRTLGMIVSNMENPFFFDIFSAVEALAHARGYDLVVANTNYRPEQLVTSMRLMIGRRVTGLAAIVSEMAPELIQELTNSRIPTVFYDVGSPSSNITNVRIDYRKGIDKLVDYLHHLGHSRMAFVGHDTALGPIHDRRAALEQALERYSPTGALLSVTGADGLEGGRMAARDVLDSGFDPTVIICVNDFMAVGVLRELRDRGVSVPRDISVAGFDNIRLSEYTSPALTTVHIPRDRIGSLVFECLVPAAGQAKAKGREIQIDPELVVRESTATARQT